MIQHDHTQHSPAFCRQILDGAFVRAPDGTLLDLDGRPAFPTPSLTQKIAGELATIAVHRRAVTTIRRAWQGWKASGHPAAPLFDNVLGHARFNLVMWRKHRRQLAELRAEQARLDAIPVLRAAE